MVDKQAWFCDKHYKKKNNQNLSNFNYFLSTSFSVLVYYKYKHQDNI
jgi:hypothetical protein